jgi:putative Holliday junction resolvase
LVDERLTTVSAQRQLHAAGHDTRSSRGVVDAVAAVILLEAALDHERNTGVPVGEVVHP